MKKIFCFLIIFVLIFVFSFAFVNVYANEETYNIDGVDYTICYENGDSATGGLYVLEEEGVIMFSVSPVTISYDGKSYVIVSSASEASFSISDLVFVEEYYELKRQINENVNEYPYVDIDDAKEIFNSEFQYNYYDVEISLEENKNNLIDYYLNVFIFRALINMNDIFETLNYEDLSTLYSIETFYLSLRADGKEQLDGIVLEFGYDTFDDLLEDFANKSNFNEEIVAVSMELSNTIYAHDEERIYSILSTYLDEISNLSYEPCYDNRSEYYDSLLSSLKNSFEEGKYAIKLFQAKERFRNYFHEFYENAFERKLYKEEDLNSIGEYISEAVQSVENYEEIDAVNNLKNEVLEYIKSFNILSIDTSNGSISSEEGINSDAILYIDEIETKDNVTTYDINLYGISAEELENQNYTISIYDVQLKYVDIEVYREFNGERIKLHSEYVNNVLTVDTDSLGTIYVVGVKKAPWGQMAIVFGTLFTLLAVTIIFFDRGKKHEARV